MGSWWRLSCQVSRGLTTPQRGLGRLSDAKMSGPAGIVTASPERSSAMITASDAHDIDVVELTAHEEQEYIEQESRRLLGMSLEEFRSRWEAGEFRDNDDPKVTQV